MDIVTVGFALVGIMFLTGVGLKYKGDLYFFAAGMLSFYELATIAADNKITVNFASPAYNLAPPSQDFNLWLALFALLTIAAFGSVVEAHTRKDPDLLNT